VSLLNHSRTGRGWMPCGALLGQDHRHGDDESFVLPDALGGRLLHEPVASHPRETGSFLAQVRLGDGIAVHRSGHVLVVLFRILTKVAVRSIRPKDVGA
jgi:hypothetical protein